MTSSSFKSGHSFLSQRNVQCPDFLLRAAAAAPQIRVGVVSAASKAALESVRDAAELDLVEPVLVGRADAICETAEGIGWDIGDVEVRAAESPQQAAEVAVRLAADGRIDALIKGDISTDSLLRAVLDRDAGLRRDEALSHVFHMSIPDSDRALFITDAVLNVQPSPERKMQIARNAISLLHTLGYEQPKIALLSASEKPSPTMPSAMEAAELAVLAAQGAFPGAVVDGPLALDLAVSKDAAMTKGVQSSVAGDADVLLVPNIETGNALFKLMVHFMSAAAAGIVLGARVPIALTSRADPVAARVASLALARVCANRQHPEMKKTT